MIYKHQLNILEMINISIANYYNFCSGVINEIEHNLLVI